MTNKSGPTRTAVWREPFETGEERAEWRRRVDEATKPTPGHVDVRTLIVGDLDADPELSDRGPDEMAQIIAKREARNHHSARDTKNTRGGSRSGRKSRKRRLKPLSRWCYICERKRPADVAVCGACGTILDSADASKKNKPRSFLLDPDFARFLENSKGLGLKLRHILRFFTLTAHCSSDEVQSWAVEITELKASDRERGAGERGGPRLFGQYSGTAFTERLPVNIEESLQSSLWLEFHARRGDNAHRRS